MRIVRARPRLFIAGALGVITTAALATVTDWTGATRLLVGWDVANGLYLALTFQMMGSSDVHRIRQRATEQDEGQFAILVLTVAAALASVAAIFAELGTSGGRQRLPVHLALAQVADVDITSKQIRRTVTAHGVVSFLFNAALLALTVNVAASAL